MWVGADGMGVMMDRYFTEGAFDPIAVVAGIIQTALYADFGYIVRQPVLRHLPVPVLCANIPENVVANYSTSQKSLKDRSSSCQHEGSTMLAAVEGRDERNVSLIDDNMRKIMHKAKSPTSAAAGATKGQLDQ